MPAASNKAELLAVTSKEWVKLTNLIASIPSELALLKDDKETSIKDVIAHRAHWIDLFLGWYRKGLSGQTVHFPAKGYKWNELKRYNADLRKRQQGLTWAEAQAMLEDRHVALVSFVNRLSNEDLYDSPMQGANNNWPPGRWAEAAGPSHYRSAAKYLRARLRDHAK